jgi:serine/threonine protein phosphatase PrpC
MSQLCTQDDGLVDRESVSKMLDSAFVNTDERLAAVPRMVVKPEEKVSEGTVERSVVTIDNSGSTACVCMVGPRDIITANVGDSRAVLGQLQGKDISSLNLSNDHKPDLEVESARITQAGCRLVKHDCNNVIHTFVICFCYYLFVTMLMCL